MTDIEHLKILKQGIEVWNKWRAESAGKVANLSGTDLSGFELSGFELSNANLSEARLRAVNFYEADLSGAKFRGADLTGANFSGANLVGAQFDGANVSGAIFGSARLGGVNLTNANLEGVNLSGADLSAADLRMAVLRRANLCVALLSNADLSGADLNEANLEGTNLDGTKFNSAGLGGADLTAAFVNSATTFAGASVDGCIIDKHTLDTLKENGGLTDGALARMHIRSDVADLRLSFSGMRLWLHICALLAFLFPYLAFIGQRYFEARFFTHVESETLPLWIAIARYIWNGGQDWQTGWELHWTFFTFIALSIYNVCRWLLLSKTIELEHRQEVSGLPVRFILAEERRWYYLVKSMKWLFWIGIAILLSNTGHFLTQEVPI